MVGFFEFLLLSWGLGAVVSLISIAEAMRDRSLTASEIASAFYYAFIAVFAFAVLLVSYTSPATASSLDSPLLLLNLESLTIPIQPSTVMVLLFSMIGLSILTVVLTRYGKTITASVFTLILLSVGFFSIIALGVYPTLNLLVFGLIVALMTFPLAFLAYRLME